jgi:hypothetical protein
MKAMRELLAASNAFRRTLLEVRKEHPNLPKRINVCIDSPKGNPSPTSQAIIITVADKVEKEVQRHADDLTAQGCSCTSVEAEHAGEVAQECDCTGVG